ncbi:hypothetical protein YPPY53_2200, partial [Yersinia pestis PY-53]
MLLGMADGAVNFE